MDEPITFARLYPGFPPEIRLPESARLHYEEHLGLICTEAADWLGLERYACMVQRLAFLSIDGQPVAFSTSYLPLELVDESDDWQQVELGELAVVSHQVTMADKSSLYARVATPGESELLGIRRRRAQVPIWLCYRPYHLHDVCPNPVRAGVVVRARCDLVRASCGLEYVPGGVE